MLDAEMTFELSETSPSFSGEMNLLHFLAVVILLVVYLFHFKLAFYCSCVFFSH